MLSIARKLTVAVWLLAALAAAISGLIWYAQPTSGPDEVPSSSESRANAAPTAGPREATSISTGADRTLAEIAAHADRLQVPPTRVRSRPDRRLKGRVDPYVALALTKGPQTTEELCPEDAKKLTNEPGSNKQESTSRTKVQGCVLPIGEESPAPPQQASMPVDRPPTFINAHHRTNFLPYAGGLGAAIASFPVISGLSKNKDSRGPISPN